MPDLLPCLHIVRRVDFVQKLAKPMLSRCYNPTQQKLYYALTNENFCFFCYLVSPTFLTLGNSNKFDCSRLIGKFCGT